MDKDTVLLLRRLEQRLMEEGHRVQGEMMGKVADRISSSADLDLSLERLYSLQGWDTIALRLMWYAKRARAGGPTVRHDALIDYQVDELHALLMTSPPASPPQAPPGRRNGQDALSGEIFEALHHFNSALDELKHSAFEGERFQGMREGLVDSALSHAGRLHQVSSAGGNETLAQFAATFSLFLRYVIERDMFDDVRVAHLIDNASQSLQGLLESLGTEDYGALLQTIDMLQNPETLLE
ncbi:MAG TPA: hypothetical protein VL221_02315 [Bacteroidota bacterium]|nr:hypothetical protein [Bacteroidota bacterium]